MQLIKCPKPAALDLSTLNTELASGGYPYSAGTTPRVMQTNGSLSLDEDGNIQREGSPVVFVKLPDSVSITTAITNGITAVVAAHRGA